MSHPYFILTRERSDLSNKMTPEPWKNESKTHLGSRFNGVNRRCGKHARPEAVPRAVITNPKGFPSLGICGSAQLTVEASLTSNLS